MTDKPIMSIHHTAGAAEPAKEVADALSKLMGVPVETELVEYGKPTGLHALCDRIEALMKASSAGEWTYDEDSGEIGCGDASIGWLQENGNIRTTMAAGESHHNADGYLIVQARAALGALIRAARENERLLELLRCVMNDVRMCDGNLGIVTTQLAKSLARDMLKGSE